MDIKRMLTEQPDLGPDEAEWITGPELMQRWQITAQDACDLASNDVLTAYWGEYDSVLWTDIDPRLDQVPADEIVPQLSFKLIRVKQIEMHFDLPSEYPKTSPKASLRMKLTTLTPNKRGQHWEEKRQEVRDAVDTVLAQHPRDHFRHESGQHKGRINAAMIAGYVEEHAHKLFPDKVCHLSTAKALRVILEYVKRR